MPQLLRNSWRAKLTAARIEVWAVSKHTLPWLDWSTFVGPRWATVPVAHLESCEAGLGRTVMGPTTPKKQRAAPQAAAPRGRTWSCSAGTRVGWVCWRPVSWWPSPPLRQGVLQLARQTEGLATHVLEQQSSEHGPSETLAIFALWAAMDLLAPTKRPHTTTSGTLSYRQWCTPASGKRCSLRCPMRKWARWR